MASSLAVLKNLPCPAGDKCDAFQCLFKHDRNTDARATGVKSTDQPIDQVTTASSSDQVLPRKRIKLDSTTSSSPHQSAISTGSQSRDSVSGLVRGPATSASTSATMGTPPKKPEALNPRLLKSAPAKHDTRLKLVKALHEQYTRLNSELKKEAKDEVSKKLVLSDQELIVKTLDDEQEMAIKRPQIYGNVIRNKIMSYKRKTVSEWKEERMLATGVSSAQNTANVPAAPQPLVTGLTPPQEVDFLHRLVWPFNGLESYGYVHSVPADDDIEQARASVQASGNVEVFPGRREEDGALTTNGSCTFHPGKTYFTERGPGKLSKAQKKYRCCHQNVDDDTTDKNRLANLLNFAETPPNPNIPADRAICFDCEMGFTAYGLELIRMTVISWPNYETLADVLVQPYGEVLDLNTRYSGVTPEDMVSAERWVLGGDHKPTIIENQQKPKLKIVASPKEARDLLFSLISPDTPLVGHGLENDMNAMRIIHPTCIDTVLLFPHRRGLPHRNSLRMLMETLLNQKIQQETDETTPEGHDSAEDAKAAGELARLKVRDEWKNLQTKGWVIKDGKVTAPGEGEKYDLPY
ncbi:ribonuclease H-like domain-containing protein [Hypoxylon trugodes]|uniref:ribonuclease H-like domain-containing protein n=1 Tax=Hypoxylon trugodes TaxID=326681 RepID=UPI002199148C|nr:ribonuclease H-like domain-containing protein [Hypoxylon trugodes]KAI1389866.1 ribonuclease H-like domain-containing protein [Hypoxylon trugodes]